MSSTIIIKPLLHPGWRNTTDLLPTANATIAEPPGWPALPVRCRITEYETIFITLISTLETMELRQTFTDSLRALASAITSHGHAFDDMEFQNLIFRDIVVDLEPVEGFDPVDRDQFERVLHAMILLIRLYGAVEFQSEIEIGGAMVAVLSVRYAWQGSSGKPSIA